MKMIKGLIVFMLALLGASSAMACGGFFCQLAPINQAGEQIVFRQDGGQITTMVRIQYSGTAENFGWVLPVPNTPEISIGSDTTFIELERVTRPQFILQRVGEACPLILSDDVAREGVPVPNAPAPESTVKIEQRLSVGPFDAQVVSSDNADALAQWLAENNFDLSERGNELLQPYIQENMKFIVLNLQSDRDVGDIQPIILKYESDKPVIPLRLTAIAAEDDMGILVWLLGESRAVPENFLHVTPNYTRLNWYTGSRNAYASYQTLITAAMDEAGGQGFATDYAGRFEGLIESLSSSEPVRDVLESLQTASSALFIQQVWTQVIDPSVSSTIQRMLPLPDGQNTLLYTDSIVLATQFTQEQLDDARDELQILIENEIIAPLDNALDVLDGDLYLTRLYTTLSADEMLLDPAFVFNADMSDQALARRATLEASCVNNTTRWTLTLGEGTGRSDQLVIDGVGDIPTIAPTIEQNATWRVEKTFAAGAPDVTQEADFAIAELGERDSQDSNSSSGGMLSWFTIFGVVTLLIYRYRRRAIV